MGGSGKVLQTGEDWSMLNCERKVDLWEAEVEDAERRRGMNSTKKLSRQECIGSGAEAETEEERLSSEWVRTQLWECAAREAATFFPL